MGAEKLTCEASGSACRFPSDTLEDRCQHWSDLATSKRSRPARHRHIEPLGARVQNSKVLARTCSRICKTKFLKLKRNKCDNFRHSNSQICRHGRTEVLISTPTDHQYISGTGTTSLKSRNTRTFCGAQLPPF